VLANVLACIRLQIFANPSAEPASGWRDMFADDMPLQNVPQIMATAIDSNGVTVTVANCGETTLRYLATSPSDIQLFQEREIMGMWASGTFDWCGLGKEDYDLAPGQQIPLAVEFWDPGRERMLASFTEKETNRCGMIVPASEAPCIGFDVRTAGLHMSATIATVAAAGIVWLCVRGVNRRRT
jgi:hypothetical protein